MKPNSISGITCYVANLARTAEFYETLGFRRGKDEPHRVTFYVNWFFVTFVAEEGEEDAELKREAALPNRGAGLFLAVKVDDVEEFHQAAVAAGLKPENEPGERRRGTREFVLRDPDGYKLAFFEKK